MLTQMAGRTIYVRLDQDNPIGGMGGDGNPAAKKIASGNMGAGMGTGGMYGGGGMGGNDGNLYGMLLRNGARAAEWASGAGG